MNAKPRPLKTQTETGLTRQTFPKPRGKDSAESGLPTPNPSGDPSAGALRPARTLSEIDLNINGQPYRVLVEPRWTLLFVLREVLGLTGSKEGCGRGECGACTVLFDDKARYACLTLAVEAEGHRVTTVEGLMEGDELGPTQQAFVEQDAFQCGYCTSGQIMAVEGLLREIPEPDLNQIRVGMSGNLCRCGAYHHIFKAAGQAARLKREKGE